MPSSWLWYQSPVARWSLGYWKIELPGVQIRPLRECASAENWS
jgi:hypothetical protein